MVRVVGDMKKKARRHRRRPHSPQPAQSARDNGEWDPDLVERLMMTIVRREFWLCDSDREQGPYPTAQEAAADRWFRRWADAGVECR